MTLHVFLFLLLFVLVFSLAWLCFLRWPHHSPAQSRQQPSAPRSTAFSSHAPHTIALPVASPAPTRQLWGLCLRLSAPGAR